MLCACVVRVAFCVPPSRPPSRCPGKNSILPPGGGGGGGGPYRTPVPSVKVFITRPRPSSVRPAPVLQSSIKCSQ